MVLNLTLALGSGILLAFSIPVSLPFYEGTYSEPLFGFIAPIVLFIGLKRVELGRSAFLLGVLAGFTQSYVALYWIGSTFGQFPLILLSAYHSLWFGALCLLLHIILRSARGAITLFLVPAVWTSVEFIRSFGASGFPWLNLSHSAYLFKPIIQLASLGGEYLVTFFIILVSYLVYFIFFGGGRFARRLRVAFLAGLLLVGTYGWGYFTFNAYRHSEAQFEKLSVSAIQGGVSSLTSWVEQSYFTQTIDAYISTSLEALRSPEGKEVKLIVWPESAVPYGYAFENPEIPIWLRPIWEANSNVAILQGAFFETAYGDLLNGALLSDRTNSSSSTYVKVRLVPFGEFVPLARIARFLEYPWGDRDISVGKRIEPIDFRGRKLAVGVCFDNLFPDVFRSQVKQGGSVIFLLANNSWTTMPANSKQHLIMDFFRAVETRRTLLRTATTGISMVVLPSGAMGRATQIGERAFLNSELPLNEGESLYTLIGDLFGFVNLFASSALLIILGVKGSSEEML